MRAIVVACVTLVSFGAAPALAECSVTRFSFYPGAEVSSNMTVSSGKSCGINLRAAGESRFDSVSVSARPKHGTVSPRAGGGVTYRAAAGYKGEDSFVFTVTGQMHTGSGTATIRISVNVI
jgi:Bacterial Ig domain